MGYSSYVLEPIPYVLAILLALALCVWFWVLYHKPVFSLCVVAALTVAQTWFVTLPALDLGTLVYPEDVVFACIAVAALMRLLGGKQMRRIPIALRVLSFVAAVSVALGLARFGRAAGVEFREDFYFWVGAIYFLSFPVTRDLLSGLARVWIVAAAAILLIVCYRWLAVALGVDWLQPISVFADPLGNLYKYRVVTASQTLILGQALILLVYAMAAGTGLRPWRFLVPLFAGAVLVLQHRSVWLATSVPLLFAFLLLKKGRDRFAGNLAVMALIASVVAVPLLAGGGGHAVTSSIASQAKAATNLSEGTSGDRVYGWKVLLTQWTHAGPVVYAAGNPYGSGYARYSKDGLEIAYAPHNYYIQTLLRTGLVGLACLLSIYWAAISWLRREPASSHPEVSSPVVVALLICQLLFFVPYWPGYSQGIILGIALSLVRDRHAGWRPPTIIEARP